jgi:hypothetical protein
MAAAVHLRHGSADRRCRCRRPLRTVQFASLCSNSREGKSRRSNAELNWCPLPPADLPHSLLASRIPIPDLRKGAICRNARIFAVENSHPSSKCTGGAEKRSQAFPSADFTRACGARATSRRSRRQGPAACHPSRHCSASRKRIARPTLPTRRRRPCSRRARCGPSSPSPCCRRPVAHPSSDRGRQMFSPPNRTARVSLMGITWRASLLLRGLGGIAYPRCIRERTIACESTTMRYSGPVWRRQAASPLSVGCSGTAWPPLPPAALSSLWWCCLALLSSTPAAAPVTTCFHLALSSWPPHAKGACE